VTPGTSVLIVQNGQQVIMKNQVLNQQLESFVTNVEQKKKVVIVAKFV